MTCPFLKETAVKYCGTATVRKLIPLAQANRTEDKCSSAEHRSCPIWRQQAEAVIAARQKIVHGAVSMVGMALKELAEQEVVHLDDERRAAMVSNLMVVLCGETEVHPVINTGTLYA